GGTYRATVALANPLTTTVYDWIEQAFEFRVIDEVNRPGYVDLAGTWDVSVRSASNATPVVAAQPAER
ncbi:MAG: hypothetical protein JOZ75_15010, partial [Candidatus Dormibacteraeota bacterium]|nr:hypothetical protein [Candidatus Dormibacteraeota bacterium]